MSTSLHRLAALALAIAPAAAIAQSASLAPATLSIATEQVYIANTTDREIVFIVETENVQRTEYRLAPGTARTFSGEPGDKWLNIEMQPGAEMATATATETVAGASH